jgi:hypothetical protein
MVTTSLPFRRGTTAQLLRCVTKKSGPMKPFGDGTLLQFDRLWALLLLGDEGLFHHRNRGRRARTIWSDYRGTKIRGRCRIGGRTILDRCQNGCCPGEGVRSPSNFGRHSLVTVMLPFRSVLNRVDRSFIDQICRQKYGFGHEYAGS